jgi:uncharacterized protein YndB with AHSA1/START domain
MTDSNTSTSVTRVIHASRPIIYQAFLDADQLARWLPPEGMRGEVHRLEPRAGGAFDMSLVYLQDEHRVAGKSAENRDTFQGRFVELVPGERIVWEVHFESDDPANAGAMRIAWDLRDVMTGTEVTCLTENIPPGIRPEDNEEGSKSSLANLAALVEGS